MPSDVPFNGPPQDPSGSPHGAPCCHHGEDFESENSTALPDPAKTSILKPYYCPMCPGVQSWEPGGCPMCGMDLAQRPQWGEPASHQSGTGSPFQRMIIAIILTVPVVFLSMAYHGFFRFLPWTFEISTPVSTIVQAALTTTLLFWPGRIIFQRAWTSLRHGALNMFTLLAMGIITSMVWSLLVVWNPRLFPLPFRAPDGALPFYFESAALMVSLVLVGQWLEHRGRGATRKSLDALVALMPKEALLVEEGTADTVVSVESVVPGAKLRVRQGESVPLDGVVIEGRGVVQEALFTGEAMAVEKGEGDALLGGSLNVSGTFVMEVTQPRDGSFLARLIQWVQQAQATRAPIQLAVDRVSAVFVPAVVALALLTLVGWGLSSDPNRWYLGLLSSISVLMIACPCALGLATPLSMVVGSGLGATHGILVGNLEALETLSTVDTMVLDKTGTLTVGTPQVVSIVSLSESLTTQEALQLAASVEQGSLHPFAQALVAEAQDRNLPLFPVRYPQEVSGQGVSAQVEVSGEPCEVRVGNTALMEEWGIDVSPWASKIDYLREQGQTAIWVAIEQGQKYHLAMVGFGDPIKEGALETVDALKALGIQLEIVSGDHPTTVAKVAETLGISRYMADVAPDAKFFQIQTLQQAGHCVAMVGDGVNDAVALSQADVGIAMGTGSDAAKFSSDMTLLKGDIRNLLKAVRLARITMLNIRQNLMLAFVYNVMGLFFATGIMYPVIHKILTPPLATLAMSLSSVSVIFNALRLRKFRLS